MLCLYNEGVLTEVLFSLVLFTSTCPIDFYSVKFMQRGNRESRWVRENTKVSEVVGTMGYGSCR